MLWVGGFLGMGEKPLLVLARDRFIVNDKIVLAGGCSLIQIILP